MQSANGLEILTWKELTLTSDAGNAALVSPMCTPNAATSLTFTGNLATFTSTTPHGLLKGQTVNIDLATDAGYNGYVVVENVISPTVFTYWLVGAPVTTPDVGGATATTLKVRKALISALSTNSGNVTFGPSRAAATAAKRTLGPGQEWELEAPISERGGFAGCFDLAQWFFKGSAVSQAISIIYIT